MHVTCYPEAHTQIPECIAASTCTCVAKAKILAIYRCYFQLRAIGQLASARARLDKAQQSLQCSHGPSGARMRRLHGNFCPELAM